MIQTWSHTRQYDFGATAIRQMRYDGSLNASKCVGFKHLDYQPNLRNLNITEKEI